jgi:nitroreductase
MHEMTADVWSAEDAAFPFAGPAPERLRFLVRYAVLAPSTHNSQPWRFRIDGDALEVHVDPERIRRVADPEGREAVVSCGAALFLLRLAMRRFGSMDEVELLPTPDDPHHVATLRAGTAAPASREVMHLFGAIRRRRTHRAPFGPRPVPQALAAALVEAAEDEGAELHLLRDEARGPLADLVARAEEAHAANPAFRDEAAAWIRRHAEPVGDGIPAEVLGIAPDGTSLPRVGRAAAADAPLVTVLATETDAPREWIGAGQALARVLLIGTGSGLSASFLNQPLQLPDARRELRRLLATGDSPQALLRIGYAPEGPRTPRRPLSEVLEG